MDVWNPVFYIVFVPLLTFALYFILCELYGLCTRRPKGQGSSSSERE